MISKWARSASRKGLTLLIREGARERSKVAQSSMAAMRAPTVWPRTIPP